MAEYESKYIPLYYSYLEQLGLLTEEQIGRLVMALLLYGRDGVQPDFPRDSSLYMAFSFIADNSRRADLRGMELTEKRREAGRKGGQASAAKAQRNEKGKFSVGCDPSKSPSKPEQIQAPEQTQAYNNKNNNKDNNKDNNNLHPRTRGTDDDCMLMGAESSVAVSYYLDMVGQPTQEEAEELMEYERELGSEAMADVITIAYEYGARGMSYIRRVVETKRQHPEHRPRLGDG